MASHPPPPPDDVEVAVSALPVLRRLQRLWLLFVAVVAAIVAATPLLDVEPSDLPLAMTATLAVAGGAGAFLAIVAVDVAFAASPPSDDLRALQEYEARKTLAFAVAQAPAVLGFALAFVLGQLLPAALGGVLAAACLIRARPSLAGLQRLEAAWAEAGKDVSAIRAAERRLQRTHPQGAASTDTAAETPDESTPSEGQASDRRDGEGTSEPDDPGTP